MLKSELDTPALLVDLSVMERNIERMARTFRDAGVGWRPHTKGLKVPQIAHKLLSAGAFGVTCAKVGEAEVMANAGIRDILIANQVVGERKIARLLNLLPDTDVIVPNAAPVSSGLTKGMLYSSANLAASRGVIRADTPDAARRASSGPPKRTHISTNHGSEPTTTLPPTATTAHGLRIRRLTSR